MKIVAGISIEKSHSDDNHSYLVLPYLENMLAPGKIEQVENNTFSIVVERSLASRGF